MVISIPLPYVFLTSITRAFLIITSSGSYPTVSTHSESSTWTLNPSAHALDWCIPRVSADDARSGTLEFSIGGDDAGLFFPVQVTFTAQGSIAGVDVARVERIDGGNVPFSCERVVHTKSYQVE